MKFSINSVVCGECPSEAKQWTAGGEEGIRAVCSRYALSASRAVDRVL
jgi:hypothetical protein